MKDEEIDKHAQQENLCLLVQCERQLNQKRQARMQVHKSFACLESVSFYWLSQTQRHSEPLKCGVYAAQILVSSDCKTPWHNSHPGPRFITVNHVLSYHITLCE